MGLTVSPGFVRLALTVVAVLVVLHAAGWAVFSVGGGGPGERGRGAPVDLARPP